MFAIKWLVLAIAVLMYIFAVIFQEKKSIIALAAGLLLVLIGVVSPRTVITELINWNVLLIFLGSLIIAELFIYSRVPALIADSIVLGSPSVGVAMTAILMMTGFISAFVENVATVLVMAPIALALCKKLAVNPAYFMTGLAVMANLQGTATLVGDPPSMIFADYAGYGFNDFFVFQGKPSVFFAVQIGMIVGSAFFYVYFRKLGKEKINIEKEKVLTWVPLALLILMIGGLAAASFVFGGLTYASGFWVMALGLAGIVWYCIVRGEGVKNTGRLIKNLDWDTALFLTGIFVVVGAVSSAGLLEDFAAFLNRIIGNNVLLGFALILAVSTVVSGFVDNVPYIIIMLPVASRLAVDLALKPELYMFALLIGSCMGGNLTPFGASANVVALGLLKKQNVNLNFWQWLKIGAPFTVITIAASSLFIWLVWR
ncbi:MAG: anion permease [Treponema sp.]|jgi:Na+/H+ antiporter NhaD/arsenite permease-like protein|nr:anion permease [Treponema sp.]